MFLLSWSYNILTVSSRQLKQDMENATVSTKIETRETLLILAAGDEPGEVG